MNWKTVKGLKMTQFPVNSNITTTGHKLKEKTTYDNWDMALHMSKVGLYFYVKGNCIEWIVIDK